MKLHLKKSARLMLGAATFAAVFAGDVSDGSVAKLSLVPAAYAVIGRPLTPMSYAGVARRTTYRAGAYGYGAYRYGYGAAVVPRAVVVAPAPIMVVQPTCFDTVNVYGVVTRVCR
jgi:hypothetical protein